MNVILIDDNNSITKALKRFLELHDIQCKIIDNGIEGLAEIHNAKDEVIILDLTMPDFSGTDVLNNLSEKGILKQRKIIIQTASNIDEDRVDKFLEMGVRKILFKPTEPEKLLEVINEVSST